jgi:hypothetical protein
MEIIQGLRLNQVFKITLPENWIILLFEYIKLFIIVLFILRIIDIISSNTIILFFNRIRNELIIDNFPYFLWRKRYYINLSEKRFIVHQNILEQLINEGRLELLGISYGESANGDSRSVRIFAISKIKDINI